MICFLFWFSVFFILYTYLFYPAAIYFAARLCGRAPVGDVGNENLPSVTIIIVAHNEERIIDRKIDNCLELDYPPDRFEVCVVSDGSTDGTADILRSRDDIVFLEDAENRGKPHQLNRAMERASSDLLVFSDSRQIFDRAALRMLVRNFSDERVGCVSGELVFITPEDPTGSNIGLYWAYEKALRQAESAVDSTLGVTGAIYAVRRELAAPIPDDTVLDDIEIPLRAFLKGYRVIFEPDAKAFDTPSTEISTEFKRKTRTLAGNYQLFARNRWLFIPWKNRIFLQALSHKFFRLLVPWAMLAAFLTSSSLEGTGFTVIFWAQAIAYGLGIAALKSVALRSSRMVNFISVFLTFNAAAVMGLYRYLTRTVDVRWNK